MGPDKELIGSMSRSLEHVARLAHCLELAHLGRATPSSLPALRDAPNLDRSARPRRPGANELDGVDDAGPVRPINRQMQEATSIGVLFTIRPRSLLTPKYVPDWDRAVRQYCPPDAPTVSAKTPPK